VRYGRLSRRDRLAQHLAAARHVEGAGNDELAGIVASHYLSALNNAPDDVDRAALASRARAALEVAATRSSALGAHSSAAGYLGDAVSLADDEAARLRLLEARAVALLAAGMTKPSRPRAARYGTGVEPEMSSRAPIGEAAGVATGDGPGAPNRSLNSVPAWQTQQLFRPAMSVGSGASALEPWQEMHGLSV